MEATATSSSPPVGRPRQHGASEPREGAVGKLPRSVSRYVLFDHIGRGGMADIYLARMRNALGGARLCVIKEILAKLSDDERFAGMLTQEAKLAAKLSHANVVQVFDLGRDAEADNRLFIAMEYVEGFDLHQLLVRLSKARVPLSADFALLIVRECLKGLDYAHRARDDIGRPLGLVHRDVSPSNVLISFEGEVKLCDFGIARALDGGDNVTEGSLARVRVAGKSAYMAPEHARGEEIDARADVFAAGILLWELCAGRRLYKGTEAQMLAKATEAVIPPLPDRGMPGHAQLQELVSRALAPAVADRFATASEFHDALEQYCIEHGLMASPLRLGAFLTDRFAEDIIAVRRANERHAQQLDEGADFESFGPSSAPPATLTAVNELGIPKPPSLPREMLFPAKAEMAVNGGEESGALARPDSGGGGSGGLGGRRGSAVGGDPAVQDRASSSVAADSRDTDKVIWARPPAPLEPPPPHVPPAASRNAGITPFSALWFALLMLACVVVFMATYFLLR